MEKYYENNHFLYLVVEVTDLYFGFDLTIVRDYEIAVKIVTQSYSVDGIDGRNVLGGNANNLKTPVHLHPNTLV